MASPTGCFVGLDSATLAQLKASALDRLTGGDITNVTEFGISYGKSYRMIPLDVLREVNYATQAASGTLPPRLSRPDFSGGCGRGHGPDSSISDFL